MKFYQYGKCSTCKKAEKFLMANNLSVKTIDITECPPSKAELKKTLKAYNGEIKRLFNTSGVQYRELKIKDKLAKMSAAEAIDLLAGNGRLIKRPLLVANEIQLIGFKEAEWESLL